MLARKEGQFYQYSKQDQLCIKKDSQINSLTVRNKHEDDYFIASPRKETEMAASANGKYINDCNDICSVMNNVPNMSRPIRYPHICKLPIKHESIIKHPVIISLIL